MIFYEIPYEIMNTTSHALNSFKSQSQYSPTRFHSLVLWIVHTGLDSSWNWKPLISGDIISREFGLHGRDISVAVNECTRWRYAHLHGTTEECISWYRKTHSKNGTITSV